MIEKVFKIPIRIESEANSAPFANGKGYWKQIKRKQKYANAVTVFLRNQIGPEDLPCLVTMIRLAPREFDYDNLVSAMKKIQDTIADFLVPGLRTGRADSDKRIEWRYEQMKGEPKEYALIIKLSIKRE